MLYSVDWFFLLSLLKVRQLGSDRLYVHFRLCHDRMMVVEREGREVVLESHGSIEAVCTAMIDRSVHTQDVGPEVMKAIDGSVN